MSKKSTGWALVKTAVYVGAVAAPGYTAYKQLTGIGQDTKTALVNTGKAYLGLDSAGNLSWATAAQMYTPLAVVTAGDIITSKLGIQKRFARIVNSVM